MFEPKFSYAKAKSEAIINNILPPWSRNQLDLNLSKTNIVSISIVSSDHKLNKFLRILVRYYLLFEGTKLKVIEFWSVPRETQHILTDRIINSYQKYGLKVKIVCLSAENTNSNVWW